MATAYQIPLQQVPNQTLTVDLADGFTYDIELRTLLGKLYMSIKQSGVYLIQNNICQDRNPIGRFVFADLDGTTDPTYTGLNARYVLGFVI